MKIFISYARVDKPYCTSIVERLHAHEVWFDDRLYAGQNWWHEILRRLEWCDVFIYLLSPDSVNSIYCQRELEVATRLERSIIPVVIHADTPIPDGLSDFHYVDMVGKLTVDNVAMLINSVWLVERELEKNSKRKKTITSESPITDLSDTREIMRQAAVAMEAGDYDNAIVLLERAKDSGFESRFTHLDKLLKMAKDALERIEQQKEAEYEYEHILSFFEYESTRQFACETFQEFREVFPNYDPQGLASRCEQLKLSADYQQDFVISDLDQDVLPMLKWCEITGGNVYVSGVESNGEYFSEMSVAVETFYMSKYPITNPQFDLFINAHDGYKNERWWKFSKQAYEWYQEQGEAQNPRFAGDNRPRETVNWYEAMAFCNWLSYTVNMRIALPTVAQWQRAAQGGDARYYPWGNEYHEDYCNTRESKLKMTTPVDQYKGGKSPFDVYDMAGNVWEWTLDMAEPNEESPDYRRAVLGGSFVSPCDRAQTSFRYYLDPRVRYPSIGFRVVSIV